MNKEEKLNFKIKSMEYEGKNVPQKYIDLFNSYIQDIENNVDTQLAELKAENERLKENNKSKLVELFDDENKKLKQQLKEKDEEIGRIKNCKCVKLFKGEQ